MSNLAVLGACLVSYTLVIVAAAGIAVLSGDNIESDVPWKEWDEQ